MAAGSDRLCATKHTGRGRPPWGDGGRVSRGKRGVGLADQSHDGASASESPSRRSTDSVVVNLFSFAYPP